MRVFFFILAGLPGDGEPVASIRVLHAGDGRARGEALAPILHKETARSP